jgi:hypothetical protein
MRCELDEATDADERERDSREKLMIDYFCHSSFCVSVISA